ncbi:MAG: DNA ligase D [Myxococcota bacterium]
MAVSIIIRGPGGQMSGKSSKSDPLEKYRAKRSAGSTPEPFGGASQQANLFVVQKHAATRMHYDFRLQWRGTLCSWAVPRGPSLDPQVKRLAVHVEDHPVEYADFEGIIPEGNYGAGAVIVWDQGQWFPLEDVEAGFAKGKLLFELRGHKLRGVWTLVQTKGKNRDSSKEWLLIKKPDAAARPGDGQLDETSIFSGLLVEQLQSGSTPATQLTAELQAQGVSTLSKGTLPPRPMLAQSVDAPFTDPNWIFELKYDGFRLFAVRENNRAHFFYRSGIDSTAIFPDLLLSATRLPYSRLVLDGEVVVLDADGRPSFQRLQKRVQLSRQIDIASAAAEHPASYLVFDILQLEAFDLRSLPLLQRKAILQRILPRFGRLRFVEHISEIGEAMFEKIAALGLEGIVAKRSDSPYTAGRTADWLKIRRERNDDFVVVGFSPPKGSRRGFGALHLGAYDADKLIYTGRVGTGFSDQQLQDIHRLLEPHIVKEPPCIGPIPKNPAHTWVAPQYVCEVGYKERTADGLLRHPRFLRWRDDKLPEQCQLHHGVDEAAPALPLAAPSPTTGLSETQEKQTNFTNLDKIFWPQNGYTKGDLITFYETVADWLLPYLRDRPVVLTRYPDGIAGKSFYQKDAPNWVPTWVRTQRIWSEHAQREIDYFVCEDVETLVFLANLGTIPLHVWSSRVSSLAQPDWCILDLDPKEAPFSDVVRIARHIKQLCDTIDLPTFIKTSGSTGLHVLIPLGGQCTYEQSRHLGQLISHVVAKELPDIATTARHIASRGDRVYLDFLQNRHGQLLASPYSVRPLPGAPVSTPLRWSEVNSRLDLQAFTLRTIPKRLKRQKKDPLLDVLVVKPDLLGALRHLQEHLAANP